MTNDDNYSNKVIIEEGLIKKGNVNDPPKVARPTPPAGQRQGNNQQKDEKK